MSDAIRRQVGLLLRRLQLREPLAPKQFDSIREIGPGCGEIRLIDGELNKEWRIFVCLTSTEVIVLERLEKRSQKTPKQTIELCRARLARYRASG
jgi:phage-related protein